MLEFVNKRKNSVINVAFSSMKHRTLRSSTLIEYTRLTYFLENISGNVTGNFRSSDSEGTLF